MDKDNINDLLHTAKELEKWQEKDVEVVEKSAKEIRRDFYHREEYDRYSRHEMCN